MKDEDKLIQQLENHRTKAPADFRNRVMGALPEKRRKRHVEFWPTHGQWIAPAFSGALATLLVVSGLGHFRAAPVASQVGFHFELHAPGAGRVELLGTFNNWQTDDIVLVGPDASGHWTATVELPEGRHEYIFLVDGERWIADPKATTFRPDGFGNVNTVIQVYDEDSV